MFAPEGERKALRPHQEKAITLLRNSLLAGKRRPMLQAPTGFGKTLVAATIVRNALARGKRVAFCVPAISLIDQTVEAFASEGIRNVGVVQAGHMLTDPAMPVQICSVQTVARRGRPDVDLVLVDEAHMQFKAVYEWMDAAPSVPFLGLSATPWTRGLGKHYDDLLIAATTRELIDAGFLSEYTVYAPSHPDLSGVRVTAGDYQQDELSRVMRDHKLVGDVVESWLKLGNDDPTLCFAVDRAHAQAIQKQFLRAGVEFGYCDAHTDLVERKVLFDRMKARKIAGICNVGTLTTGVDADVRTLILARPTKSASLFVQIIGRALRTAPGKSEAVIIDHSDTTLRLGLPCSIMRTKLSTGDKRESKGEVEPPVRTPKPCPKCATVKPVGVHQCPKCGFEPENVRAIEAAEGELVAIKPGKTREATQGEKQLWYSMLLHIQRERGRSLGWVSHSYRDKFGVWPKGLQLIPAEPSPQVRSWVKAKDIRFAKARGKTNAA